MAGGINTGSIYYEVEADTSKLVNSTTAVDGSLDQLNKTFTKTDKAANQTQFAMSKTATAVKGLGTESQGAASQVGGLAKVLGGLLTLQGAKGLIEMADAYNEMAERISMATSSAEEYEHVQKRLLATANATYRPLSEAQDLFVLTSATLRSLGYDTDQSMDIVDSLSFAFVKNATAADRAKSAINAVTGSLNKGKVDAQAWQTILAAIPTVVQDLAESTGMAEKQILQLGAAGKITGQQLSEGLRNSLVENKKAADGMATTVKDAFVNLRNNLSVFVGEANRSSGATQLLSSAIVLLGDNIDTVAKALIAVGAGALARYISQLGISILASARAALAARAQAAEELKLATAHVTSTAAALAQTRANTGLATSHTAGAQAATTHAAANTRLAAAQTAVRVAGSGLLAIMGGPAGIVALIATAATGMALFASNTTDAKPPVDLLTGALNDLGDAQLRVLRTGLIDEISAMESLAGAAKKSGAKIEWLNQQLAMHPNSKEADGWKRSIDAEQAAIEEATKSLKAHQERKRLVEAEQEARASGKVVPTVVETEDGKKYIQSLQNQNALLRVQGEERVRLRVAQELQGKATDKEIESAQALAVEQYHLEESQKALASVAKERTKATKDDAKATEENAKAIAKLEEELLLAIYGGEALAESKALASLNEFATPEEIARVKELSAAIQEITEAERLRSELAKVDKVEGENQRHEEELARLAELNEAKLLENERYLELKLQAEEAHAERIAEIQEEEFRKQSEWNEILMSTLDRLETATTDAITGLITGASTGTQALQAMGQAILKDVVGSFVKMGVEHVKAVVMGRVAQSAAGAAYATATAAQVNATTALAGQAAFASTAAIPVVGPGLAPAAAAAAIAAATGLGAPAIAASVIAGNRQYGGPVSGNSMYRVNEDGKPEVLNMANGQQFLLPNGRGEVVSNKDASARGNAALAQVTVNLIEDASKGGQVNQRQNEEQTIIDIVVASIRGDGDVGSALSGKYNLETVGR